MYSVHLINQKVIKNSSESMNGAVRWIWTVNNLFNATLRLSLGNTAWPSGVFLKYTAGDQLGPVNLVSVKPLDAGEYHDLSVNMISPGKPGMYQGQWRMCLPSGQYFGGEYILWCC